MVINRVFEYKIIQLAHQVTQLSSLNMNADDVKQIVASIASVPLDDGVSFYIKSIAEIIDEAEYPGIRISIEIKFDGVITPLYRLAL